MRVFSNSFLRLCSQFKKEAKKSLQGAQCDCPACSCRATALLLMYASSCLTRNVGVNVPHTHFRQIQMCKSGHWSRWNYQCAHRSPFRSVHSGTLSNEAGLSRFFLFSSCFVFPNVFWGKEILVLSLFVLVQNQIFTCSRDHRTQYNWASCLLCSSPANQKLCYWKCGALSTSWHLALIRGTIRYSPIFLILWFLLHLPSHLFCFPFAIIFFY